MKVIDLSKIKENEPLTSDVKAWIGLRVRVRRGLASGCGNDPHRTRPHKYATWLALQQVQEQGFDPKVRSATVALYKQGRPLAEIQAQLGVSQAYISKTATEEGINRHKFK